MSTPIYKPSRQNGTPIYRPGFNGSGTPIYGFDPTSGAPPSLFRVHYSQGIWDSITGKSLEAILPGANDKSVEYIDGSVRYYGSPPSAKNGEWRLALRASILLLNPDSDDFTIAPPKMPALGTAPAYCPRKNGQ